MGLEEELQAAPDDGDGVHRSASVALPAPADVSPAIRWTLAKQQADAAMSHTHARHFAEPQGGRFVKACVYFIELLVSQSNQINTMVRIQHTVIFATRNRPVARV